MRTRILLVAGALLIASPQGRANPWYAGIDFLWSFADADDVGLDGPVPPGTFKINDSSDPTVVGASGRLGYDRGNLRLEGEYTWRYRFDFNTRVGTQGAGTKFEDDVRTQTAMVNLFWDFTSRGRLTPYVGAGLGVVWNESDIERTNEVAGTVVSGSNTEVSPAWSLMVGGNWAMSERWKLRLGYRFVSLGEIDSGSFGDGVSQKADEFYSHDISLGLRYEF